MSEKLEVQFANKLRALNRKRPTIECYVGAYLRYMRWIRESRGQWMHPNELNERDLESWLTHLAVVERLQHFWQTRNWLMRTGLNLGSVVFAVSFSYASLIALSE